jgi:hypothetical protein
MVGDLLWLSGLLAHPALVEEMQSATRKCKNKGKHTIKVELLLPSPTPINGAFGSVSKTKLLKTNKANTSGGCK